MKESAHPNNNLATLALMIDNRKIGHGHLKNYTTHKYPSLEMLYRLRKKNYQSFS